MNVMTMRHFTVLFVVVSIAFPRVSEYFNPNSHILDDKTCQHATRNITRSKMTSRVRVSGNMIKMPVSVDGKNVIQCVFAW